MKINKGAQASAKVQRQKALDKYYLSPNKCLCCDKIIEVGNKKVADAKRKKFCNNSCSASFNNKLRPKKITKKYKRAESLNFLILQSMPIIAKGSKNLKSTKVNLNILILSTIRLYSGSQINSRVLPNKEILRRINFVKENGLVVINFNDLLIQKFETSEAEGSLPKFILAIIRASLYMLSW